MASGNQFYLILFQVFIAEHATVISVRTMYEEQYQQNIMIMLITYKNFFNLVYFQHQYKFAYFKTQRSFSPSLNPRQILEHSLNIYVVNNWTLLFLMGSSLSLVLFSTKLERSKTVCLSEEKKKSVDKRDLHFGLIYQIAKHCLRNIITSSSEAVFSYQISA